MINRQLLSHLMNCMRLITLNTYHVFSAQSLPSMYHNKADKICDHEGFLVTVCVCVCAPVVHRGSTLMSNSKQLKLQVIVSHQTWVLGIDWHPQKEQQTLLTAESSLQPLLKVIYMLDTLHSLSLTHTASVKGTRNCFSFVDDENRAAFPRLSSSQAPKAE